MNHYHSCCCYTCIPGRSLADMAMTVWRIRIEKITSTLGREQVESARVAAHKQEDVERVAAAMLTVWLRANPGTPGSYVISTIPSSELGGE